MEEHAEPKKRRNKVFFIASAGVIMIAVVLLSASVFLLASTVGFTKKPVFFTDGKIVKLVDTQAIIERVKEIKVIEAPKKDPEKEILKIAYCIQSLQPKHSHDSAVLIAKTTYKECNEKGISIPLWVALMFAESSLDPMKASPMGAFGLSQVRYSVWKEQPELIDNGVLIKDKLFWVDLNIKCGTTIFKKFYDESGKKIGNALWRYNSGQTKLPENKRAYDIEYVAKIMYYTHKVTEILAQEDVVMHPINDPEAQSEVAGFTSPVVEHKDKPVVKRSTDKKETQQ